MGEVLVLHVTMHVTNPGSISATTSGSPSRIHIVIPKAQLGMALKTETKQKNHNHSSRIWRLSRGLGPSSPCHPEPLLQQHLRLPLNWPVPRQGRNAAEQVKMLQRIEQHNSRQPPGQGIRVSVEVEKTREELFQLFGYGDVVSSPWPRPVASKGSLSTPGPATPVRVLRAEARLRVLPRSPQTSPVRWQSFPLALGWVATRALEVGLGINPGIRGQAG